MRYPPCSAAPYPRAELLSSCHAFATSQQIPSSETYPPIAIGRLALPEIVIVPVFVTSTRDPTVAIE